MGKNINISYDESTLKTVITVDGKSFDTSRIDGRPIDEWVCPFMMKKIRWNGIFEELAKVVNSTEYIIQFSGSASAMMELMEECPETVTLTKGKSNSVSSLRMNHKQNDDYSFMMNITYKMDVPGRGVVVTGNIKRGMLRNDDIVQILNLDGSTISATIGGMAMFGKALDLAETGDTFDTLLCNVDFDDIKVGFQVICTPNSMCSNVNAVIEEAYDVKELCDCGDFYSEEGSYVTAVEWYRKAAEQGHSTAQNNLGNCYFNGIVVEQNYLEAVKWYKKSAEQGNGYAQETLGDCYYEGKGVQQSYVTAVEWYRKALENGLSRAYYDLGSCYRWGNGVNKDKEKAKELFRKGIELGDQASQQAYDDMMKNGDKIETAKKIGGGILKFFGQVAGSYAGAYTQSLLEDDDDEY